MLLPLFRGAIPPNPIFAYPFEEPLPALLGVVRSMTAGFFVLYGTDEGICDVAG